MLSATFWTTAPENLIAQETVPALDQQTIDAFSTARASFEKQWLRRTPESIQNETKIKELKHDYEVLYKLGSDLLDVREIEYRTVVKTSDYCITTFKLQID